MDEPFRESISFEHQNFVAMPDRSWTQTAVMALVQLIDGEPYPIGTCFSIFNDGLCLTARHVIEEAFPEALRFGREVSEQDGWIYAVYASPTQEGSGDHNHDLGGLLPATNVYIVDGLDIAALHLNLPVHSLTGERIPMPAHGLGLAPPHVGERCFAVGYHAMQWERAKGCYNVQQGYSATRGEIEEIHIPKRDSSSLNFPCFRTSARFDGGMSGAPVMSEDGWVRGVVCSSYKTLDDPVGHTSYASLIAPAVLLQIDARERPNGPVAKRFLWDFVLGGAVLANTEGVEIHRGEGDCAVRLGGAVITNRIGV